MASEKRKLLDWFYRADLPEGEIVFDDLLQRAAVEALGKDAAAAAAYVASSSRRVWNVLIQEIDLNRKFGVCPLMRDYVNAPIRRSTWYPSSAGCSADSAREYESLKSRPLLLRTIDGLNDREYEAAGMFLSQLAGADRFVLTPRGNEGGVDFFAQLVQPSHTHIFGGAASPIRIVGQSKKYETKVSVDRIRDFITTLNDVRHVAIRMNHLIPPWFQDSRGPVVGWIISHQGFQKGAETMARNHGIILSTTLDMAEVCTQSGKMAHLASAADKSSHLISSVRNHLL